MVSVSQAFHLLGDRAGPMGLSGPSGPYGEDCSNFNSLPKLGFQIGDKVLNLRPDDYMDAQGSGVVDTGGKERGINWVGIYSGEKTKNRAQSHNIQYKASAISYLDKAPTF